MGDCYNMVSEHVENMNECYVSLTEECGEIPEDCHVMLQIDGVWYEGECDEMSEWFQLPEDLDDDLIDWDEDYSHSDLHDEECIEVCMTPFECAETPFEWCEMTECHNECEDHHTCYA